jgi:putative DNA primase/helicase
MHLSQHLRGSETAGVQRDKSVIRYAAGRVDTLTDEAENALICAKADVFCRADRLVRPGFLEVPAADGRTTRAAGVYVLDHAALTEELNRVSEWQQYDGRSKKWVTINPPALIVRALNSRKGRWRLRPVSGVITCPTMRPDGTILAEAGYDSATRLYLVLDSGFQLPDIPELPSRGDAGAALKLLSELLSSPLSRALPTSRAVSTRQRQVRGPRRCYLSRRYRY